MAQFIDPYFLLDEEEKKKRKLATGVEEPTTPSKAAGEEVKQEKQKKEEWKFIDPNFLVKQEQQVEKKSKIVEPQEQPKEKKSFLDKAKGVGSAVLSHMKSWTPKGQFEQAKSVLPEEKQDIWDSYAKAEHILNPTEVQNAALNKVILLNEEDLYARLREEESKPLPDTKRINELNAQIKALDRKLELPNNDIRSIPQKSIPTTDRVSREIASGTSMAGRQVLNILTWLSETASNRQTKEMKTYSDMYKKKAEKTNDKKKKAAYLQIADEYGKFVNNQRQEKDQVTALSRNTANKLENWEKEISPAATSTLGDKVIVNYPQVLMFMATAMLGGGEASASERISGALSETSIGKKLAEFGATKGGRILKKLIPMGSSMAEINTVQESAMNAAQDYEDLRKQGMSPDKANTKAAQSFIYNLIVNYYTDSIGMFSENKAGQSVLKRTLYSAPPEVIQEGWQQVVSNYQTGRPILEGVLESMEIGGIYGAGGGAMMSIYTGEGTEEIPIGKDEEKNREVDKKIYDEAIKKGDKVTVNELGIRYSGDPEFHEHVGTDLEMNSQELFEAKKERLAQVIDKAEKGETTQEETKATQSETKKEETKQPQVAETTLQKEAKKYKSADEFIKAQGKKFIHETNAENIEGFSTDHVGKNTQEAWLGKGVYLQEDGTFKIEKYGKNQVEAYLTQDAKVFEVKDTPKGKWRDNLVETIANKFPKLEQELRNEYNKIAAVPTEEGFAKFVKEKLPRDFLMDKTPQQVKELIGDYDAILQDGELVVFNTDVIKTKSQLKKIWGEANERKSTETATNKGKTKNESVQKKPKVTKPEQYQKASLEKGKFVTTDEALQIARDIPFFRQIEKQGGAQLVNEILTPEGKEALGKYSNTIISYVENPHETTLPHEVFHAFVDQVATDEQLNEAYRALEKREGRKLTDKEAEEILAQDFAEWFVANRKPKTVYERFLDYIKKMMKSFARHNNKIQDLFDSILSPEVSAQVESFREAGGIQAVQQEYYQNPKEFTTKIIKALDAVGKEYMSYGHIQQVVAQLGKRGLKKAEIDLVKYIMEEPEFKGQKRVKTSDFIARMNSELLDFQVKQYSGGDAYSDYGSERVSLDGLWYTSLLTTEKIHNHNGHFTSQLSARVIPEDLDIYYVKAGTYEVQDQTVNVDKDQYIVYNKNEPSMAENPEAAALGVFDTEEEAQRYIDNFKPQDVERSLFGHYRGVLSEDGKITSIVEVQSDPFQHNVQNLKLAGEYGENISNGYETTVDDLITAYEAYHDLLNNGETAQKGADRSLTRMEWYTQNVESWDKSEYLALTYGEKIDLGKKALAEALNAGMNVEVNNKIFGVRVHPNIYKKVIDAYDKYVVEPAKHIDKSKARVQKKDIKKTVEGFKKVQKEIDKLDYKNNLNKYYAASLHGEIRKEAESLSGRSQSYLVSKAERVATELREDREKLVKGEHIYTDYLSDALTLLGSVGAEKYNISYYRTPIVDALAQTGSNGLLESSENNIERINRAIEAMDRIAINEITTDIGKLDPNRLEKKKESERKLGLFKSYKNFYQELLLRTAIRDAAMKGSEVLRFPTPHVIADVEGYSYGVGTGNAADLVEEYADRYYPEQDVEVLDDSSFPAYILVSDSAIYRTTVDDIYEQEQESFIENFWEVHAENYTDEIINTIEMYIEISEDDMSKVREDLYRASLGEMTVTEALEKNGLSIEDVEKEFDMGYYANQYIADKPLEEWYEYVYEDTGGIVYYSNSEITEVAINEDDIEEMVDETGGAADFELEDISDPAHRRIAGKWAEDGAFIKYLKKVRKDLKLVEDGGYYWWETKITPEDKGAVEMFQTKDRVSKEKIVINKEDKKMRKALRRYEDEDSLITGYLYSINQTAKVAENNAKKELGVNKDVSADQALAQTEDRITQAQHEQSQIKWDAIEDIMKLTKGTVKEAEGAYNAALIDPENAETNFRNQTGYSPKDVEGDNLDRAIELQNEINTLKDMAYKAKKQLDYAHSLYQIKRQIIVDLGEKPTELQKHGDKYYAYYEFNNGKFRLPVDDPVTVEALKDTGVPVTEYQPAKKSIGKKQTGFDSHPYSNLTELTNAWHRNAGQPRMNTKDVKKLMLSDDKAEVEKGLARVPSVEFPELVQLARELTGQIPQLNRRLRTALGKAKLQGGETKIELNPVIFSDEILMSKTLAHELGHIVDWLPDNVGKKNNLVGKLKDIHGFMKGTYGELNDKVLRDELKAWTMYWNPFDPKENSNYTKYRYNAKELYAEAISGILVDPTGFQKVAPKFYTSFFANLDLKPKAQQAFLDTFNLINKGEYAIARQRDKMVNEMFENGERAYMAKLSEKDEGKNSIMVQLQYEFIDKNIGVIRKINELKKQGVVIPEDEDPRYALEEMNYVGGKVKAFGKRYFDPIYRDLKKNEILWNDFGQALMYKRIISGDRGEIANPKGLSPTTARSQLDWLENKLGAEKWAIMQKNLAKFKEATDRALDIAASSQLYSKEIVKELKANPTYATFQVVDYIDTKITPFVIKQYGTLKDIPNPANSTILKVEAMLRASEKNKVALKGTNFLKKYTPEDIKPADKAYDADRNAQIPIESKDPNWELLEVRENGKPTGYYVDPYWARAYKYNNVGELKMLMRGMSWINNNMFRPLFIRYNLGFTGFNFVRDLTRYVKAMPLKSLVYYGKAAPHALKKGFNMHDNLVNEMEENGIFSITYNDLLTGQTKEDVMAQTVLAKMGLEKFGKDRTKVKKLLYALDAIDQINEVVEALPKIAAYQYYKDNTGDVSPQVRSFIRSQVGSPDFLRRGSLYYTYNEFLLFSNAIKEGIRGDLATMTDPRTRSGYWLKTTATTFLPKMLMYAALMGLFGDELKKEYENISEYNMTNYIVIPLYIDANGKSVAIRIPNDETGRLMGGLFWKFMQMANKDNPNTFMQNLLDVVSFTGGQLPSPNPAFTVTSAWLDFMGGRNPYDSYRQRNIIPEDEYLVGGRVALEPLADWSLKSLGLGIFFPKNSYQSPETKTFLQKVTDAPVVSNIIGRWVITTDRGQREKMEAAAHAGEKARAQKRITTKNILNEYIPKYEAADTVAEKRTVEKEMVLKVRDEAGIKDAAEVKRLLQKLKLGKIKKENDSVVNAIIYSTSNDEKADKLAYLKKKMTPEEYKSLLKKLVTNKIVSLQVIKQANSK